MQDKKWFPQKKNDDENEDLDDVDFTEEDLEKLLEEERLLNEEIEMLQKRHDED